MADDALDLLLALARNQTNRIDVRDDTLVHVLKNVTLETITLSDLQSVTAAFVVQRNESVSLTATQNVIVAFVASAAEKLSLIESETARADFVGQALEQIGLSDHVCAFGWFGLNDDQDPQWGIETITVDYVAAYGAFAFGDLSIAGNRKGVEQVPKALPPEQNANWAELDDASNNVWDDVDNEQKC